MQYRHQKCNLIIVSLQDRANNLLVGGQFSCGVQENISLVSWFMALKLLDCAASVFSFQKSVEVSRSFEMLSCKEKMLVVFFLLFCCLLGGTDPAWRDWSCLFGVMDKDRWIELSEDLMSED